MFKKLLIATVFCVSTLVTVGQAEAHGYGFPPFGAWAYGTGYRVAGYPYVARSRTVYRPYHGSYRSVSRVRYAPYAYHPYTYRSLYYRPYTVYPRYYRTYYVAPVTPVIHYTPVIRSFYYTPITPLCTNQPVQASPQYTVMAPSPAPAPAQQASPVLLVSQQNQATPTNSAAPPQFIEIVDQMVQAGGYREAAKAYAELSVRFGSTDELLTRRYVALVLNGDYGQAEVLVELSQVLGKPIALSRLPNNLRDFANAAHVNGALEGLAERALKDRDPTALRSVAHWLQLCGEEQRSQLFFQASSAAPQDASRERIESNIRDENVGFVSLQK